ncbi:MAG: hypothetical protein AAF747_11880 [Planctomycetota bacterium]
MTPLQITGLVCVFLAVDAVVVFAVVKYGVREPFAKLAAKYPPTEPAHDAESRRRQGISYGLANLGWSFTISVDAEFVHLEPNKLARLFGGRAVSLPRGALQRRSGGVMLTPYRIDIGEEIYLPKWVGRLVG